MTRTANVVGLGLIGGSIAAALTERGWRVHGDDADPEVLAAALERGLVGGVGLAAEAEITFVSVPVAGVPDQVRRALQETTGVVTDVGSVKATICADCADERFVGGHPMAGSERDGLDGADPSMFERAVWVLTPTSTSSDQTFAEVARIVAELGADVVALDPRRHDRLVAVVSHVPHLTAASLMGLAVERADEHMALLRLAAGGFRDMTRIAAGRPEIWLDICAENRSAISETLAQLIGALDELKGLVESGDRVGLLDRLSRARAARSNLPGRIADPSSLTEFRIPIPDRPGAAAEVFTLAAELGVNIVDFEVVHLAEEGVATILVDADVGDVFRGGLLARGFRPSAAPLV